MFMREILDVDARQNLEHLGTLATSKLPRCPPSEIVFILDYKSTPVKLDVLSLDEFQTRMGTETDYREAIKDVSWKTGDTRMMLVGMRMYDGRSQFHVLPYPSDPASQE